MQFGNYINLPYHGFKRPILWFDRMGLDAPGRYTLEGFLEAAEAGRNDPADWHKKAGWLLIEPPGERENQTEFGTQRSLHICAERVIREAETNPVVEGHRSAVFFALAKQLANCSLYDEEETLMLMRRVNSHALPPEDDSEIRRIMRNAYEKRYTSTGCDDPLFAPYADPACPIANPRR